MKTMKASRIYGPNDIRYVDVPMPEVGPRDVLSKVVRAGVCGTDLAIYTGEFSFVRNGNIKFPMTPGHEWAGIVEKVGPEVTLFKPGDRVVGDTGVVCGECNSLPDRRSAPLQARPGRRYRQYLGRRLWRIYAHAPTPHVPLAR